VSALSYGEFLSVTDTSRCVVGVLIGVMKKEEMYIHWVAVGWKLGAGRLNKCPGHRPETCSAYHKYNKTISSI
jgi:hypothetical protein